MSVLFCSSPHLCMLEMLREKREQIEGELYRFASTITQELKNSRDVLSMLAGKVQLHIQLHMEK